MLNMEFFKNKKILVTGHTGFKGSWLCKILIDAGANVVGYALNPPTQPNLFSLCKIEEKMSSFIGDIRDLNKLMTVFQEEKPEIVFHLAAQPIVRDSYKDPVYTYETNVMGTVNVLECCRKTSSVKSFLNVTTDKVYKNFERDEGYCEEEQLDGFDPYSNSKSCSELVTHAYKNSFFENGHISISTARAGNVIGGGDFALDRIIPDCFRAAEKKEKIIVRNPKSVRPFQHVLEPTFMYLLIAQKQYEDVKYADCYNIGPDYSDCITAEKIVEMFCNKWGEGLTFENVPDNGPHEAILLKLNCEKIKSKFDWKPKWNLEKAVEESVKWYKVYLCGENIIECMENQIKEYMG